MDNYRSDKYPGLVAIAHPDEDTISPIREAVCRGIQIVSLERRAVWWPEAETGHLEIECPQCEGYGGTVWDRTGGMAQSCAACDESGELEARTGPEWSKAN